MKLSGDMAKLLLFDQLEKRTQEEIGEAMLFDIVQLFQEMCRSLKQEATKRGRPAHGRKDKKQQGQQQKTDADIHTGRKIKQSKEKSQNEDLSTEKKKPMKQATDVISRIIWDPDLPTELFTVGYLDRFVGIIEKPFSAFSWEDIASVDYSTLAIPKHRIQYFKYKDQIVWDKTTQTDDVFGSRGSGKTVADVIKEYDSKQPQCNENESSQGRLDAHHSESDVDDDDDDEIDPKAEEVRDRKKKYANLHRATHFICIPITSPQIRAAAQDVQEALCYSDPRLTDGCLAISALHVTLAMVRINSDKDLQSVKQLLTNLQLSFISMFDDNSELYFESVSHFRDRVLYTKPRQQSTLSAFAALLLQKLTDNGIPTPGNYSEFSAHVTLIKLSRPMCRQYDMMSIERSLYLPFADKVFGRQHIERLHLCSITGPKEDGFYQRLHTVENSMIVLSPIIPRLIQRACNKAIVNNILSQEMADSINDATDKHSANQRELFEHLATTLLSLTGQPTLVILRGLPGSGKSTAARAIADGLDCICSADDYFETKQGYHYDKTKLTAAHTQCFLKCIKLMESETPLVIVDNINQHRWIYSAYKQLASIVGYRVKILELPCPNQMALGNYASRSVHKVPIESCAKMLKEWERDSMAVEITQDQVNDREMLNDILAQECVHTDSLGNSEFVVYTGVFLTKESREMLLSVVPPVHEVVVCDHMTMQFNPEPDQVNIDMIGNTVYLQVVGVASDSYIQAVVVESRSESTASANALPHITVSHTSGVKANYSNEMLLKRTKPLDQVKSDMVLTGIVGAKVGKGNGEITRCVTDKMEVSTVVHQQWLNNKMWPQRIDIPTCQLFVFDFDGTLVESPDPAQGRREYKRLTGQEWPHKKFLGRPESLCDPFTVKAGPAMADFHSHCGRAGSLSFVLTARLTSLQTAVKTWLERYNMYPDRLIMKPDNSNQTAAEFKADTVKGILSEFPTVRSIKLWDDSDDNLKVFQAVSRQLPAINFTIIDSKRMSSSQRKTEVDQFLQQSGSLPHPSFLAASESAICFVSEVWQNVIKVSTDDPRKLSLPFGSSQLGRFADVDVCLLAPNSLSHRDCVVQLEKALKDYGVTFTYISHSSRCPRLKAKCFFAATSPVELDVVFCLVPLSFLDCLDSGPKPSLNDITAAVAKSDKASHTALTGPLFLQEILTAISKSRRVVSDCVCLIEIVCVILKANCLKGNAFHCIRTFHLIKLLQHFLQAAQELSTFTLDELLIKFVEFCASYTTAQWSKLFCEFVPSQYISPLSHFFMTTQKLMQPVITTELLYQLATAREPVTRRCEVELTFSSPDLVHMWHLGIFIEARLGSYIRLLLSSGTVVQPSHIKPTKVSFALEDTAESLHTVNQVFASFWDELINFSRNAASTFLMSLFFPSTKQTTVIFSHGGISAFSGLMEEFAGGQHGQSVHLPKALGKYERLKVHELANELGLEHGSQGVDKDRHVILTRKDGKQ